MQSSEDAEEIVYNKMQQQSEIFSRFSKFQKKGLYCDFEIVVKDKTFSVHQNVICANSEYFRAMLEHDTKEKNERTVELQGLDASCVESCIRFMYSDSVHVCKSKWEDLMKAADMLQLPKLCAFLSAHLGNKLDVESFYDVLMIGRTYTRGDLRHKCMEFAASNFQDISKSKNYKNLDQETITDLLTSKLQESESEKVAALINWAIWDEENRRDFFDSMLLKLDMYKVEKQYRRYILEKEPLVSESLTCFKHVSMSLLDTYGLQSITFSKVPKNSAVVIFDGVSKKMQSFTPSKNEWKVLEDIPNHVNDKNFSAVALQDSIFVLKSDRSVYEMKLKDQNPIWQVRASSLCDHGIRPATITKANSIYAILGSNQKADSCIEIYNPLENRWDVVTTGTERMYHASVLLCGKICCIGGKMNGQLTASVTTYDLDLRKWTELQPLPSPRWFPGAVAYGSSMFAFGGYTENMEINETLFLDADTTTWTKLQPMIRTRHCFGAYLSDGKIYALGGWERETRNNMECYSVSENTWEEIDVPMTGLNILGSTALFDSCN